MTPSEEVFNYEMERASEKRPATDDYWNGYAAGLMRARFGSVAVGDKYHEAWQQTDAPGELGRGYRDGYARLTDPLTIASCEPGRPARWRL